MAARAAKKPKKKHDALALASKGEEFVVTVELPIDEYGVDSVAVRMKKNMLTEFAECLSPGCVNSAWCNGSSTNAMFFAIKHVKAHHLPEKVKACHGSGGKAKNVTHMSTFFSPVKAPAKIVKFSLSASTPGLDTLSTDLDLVEGGSLELHEPLLRLVFDLAAPADIVQLNWPCIVPCFDSLSDVLQKMMNLDINTAPLARARDALRTAGAAVDDVAAAGLADLAALTALAHVLPNLAVLAAREMRHILFVAVAADSAPPLPLGAADIVDAAVASAMRVAVTVDHIDISIDTYVRI
jgi:hypothetical protein